MIRRLLISRRDVFGLAGLGAAGALLAGCSSSASGGASSGSASSGGVSSSTSVSSARSSLSGPSASVAVPSASKASIAPQRFAYGSDPSQYGELYLPSGARQRGVAVIIHGGFWQAQYTAGLGAPLALDLARRGWAAWNLDYRRLGDGGGWPATFLDIAAGIDLLASSALRGSGLDLGRVVAIGHSAGGQLAVWAAARRGLPTSAPGASPKVRLRGVVSQAGVLDLVRAAQTSLGGSSASDLVGGSPSAVPGRYALASPVARVPVGVPVRCVHSPDDGIVPLEQSERYVSAATAAGDDAALVRTSGDHFALISVGQPAWTTSVTQFAALTA